MSTIGLSKIWTPVRRFISSWAVSASIVLVGLWAAKPISNLDFNLDATVGLILAVGFTNAIAIAAMDLVTARRASGADDAARVAALFD